MQYETIYFWDASALIKIFFEEPGSDSVRAFYKEQQGQFYTTSLCIGETLGVMKRERMAKRITQKRYTTAAHAFLSEIKSSCIGILEESLTDSAIFFEAVRLSDKYKIDLIDAHQIVTLRLSKIVGATLISADKGLLDAARHSGIVVWDCLRESKSP